MFSVPKQTANQPSIFVEDIDKSVSHGMSFGHEFE
jgi:hypothetical protein